MIKDGARLTLTNRRYNFLIVCLVFPQVLHRVIENLFTPTFAKKILKDGSLSGVILGGSNLGELFGALLIGLCGQYFSGIGFVKLECLFHNL